MKEKKHKSGSMMSQEKIPPKRFPFLHSQNFYPTIDPNPRLFPIPGFRGLLTFGVICLVDPEAAITFEDSRHHELSSPGMLIRPCRTLAQQRVRWNGRQMRIIVRSISTSPVLPPETPSSSPPSQTLSNVEPLQGSTHSICLNF